jgi:hypothetical protein
MILSNGQFLDSARFNAIVQEESADYLNRLPLRFLDRLPIVPADDDEIIAVVTNRIACADIIADDQEAVVYQAGIVEFQTNVIPNIKSGRRFSQATLARLARLARNAGIGGPDVGFFRDWEVQTARRVVGDVRERMNVLACAMMLDAVTYDRLGIKITAGWGMPSSHKVTPANLWTDATNGKPVTDLLTLRASIMNNTGRIMNRATMGTTDFINAVSTAEFRNLLAGLVNAPLGASTGAFNARDPKMTGFFSQLTQMDVEIDDKQVRTVGTDGTETLTRVLPAGKVLLSSTSDDNNPATWDFASAVVIESLVASIIGETEVFGGEQRGPVAYYTGNEDLNPPNLIAWGVMRGFPRKFDKYATAVLTVA